MEIIVALDADFQKSKKIVCGLGSLIQWYKVGPMLFMENPSIIEKLKFLKKKVMLDFKFFDIPNTVYNSVKQVSEMGADKITIHLMGGKDMVLAAKQATDSEIIGVSVLTSMDDTDLTSIGINAPCDQQVDRLISLGVETGIDGIVCSAHETRSIKNKYNIQTINPGIRLTNNQDQKRVCTPVGASETGTDYIVMGRPIIDTVDPVKTVKRIYRDLGIVDEPVV